MKVERPLKSVGWLGGSGHRTVINERERRRQAMAPRKPGTPMVTGREVAELREGHGPEVGICVECREDWPCTTWRITADRERTLGLLEHAQTALNSAHAEVTGMAAALGSPQPLNILSDIAHAQRELGKALKEAGRGA